MVIGVIPVIDGCMVLPGKEIVVAFKVVTNDYPFNANAKIGSRRSIKFKYGFTEKGDFVVQFRGDKEVLFAESKGELIVFIIAQDIHKSQDFGVLRNGPGGQPASK